MPFIPELGRVVFVNPFHLCVIFVFCWHESIKREFLYTKKRMFSCFVVVVFFFFVFFLGGDKIATSKNWKVVASRYFSVEKKSLT